jgi:hypothetical protein
MPVLGKLGSIAGRTVLTAATNPYREVRNVSSRTLYKGEILQYNGRPVRVVWPIAPGQLGLVEHLGIVGELVSDVIDAVL